MIPRLLVPLDARPTSLEATSSRRRPSLLDERTLVPATLPVIPLNGHSNIPSSLPLESIAPRIVVPRDIQREDLVTGETGSLPLQPTVLDARITVPQGAAPPEIIPPAENIPIDLVGPDIFMTGEVHLLSQEPPKDAQAKWELIRLVSSVAFHVLLITAIILEPKLFPPRAPSQEQQDLARRQIMILLPPGALDAPKTAPRPKQPATEAMRIDPRILRRVAPPEPEPQPAPQPKEPERVVKELPSAPVPQPNARPPAPQAPVAQADAPKPPLKLETLDEQPSQHTLQIPKSPGRSIQDSIRESAKMNAPSVIGRGGQLPSSDIPGAGNQGSAYGAMELLTPPEGVDFSDYLARVYQSVKQNWFAVMPESVRLGDKGVVSLEFRIMKNGSVPAGEPVRVRGSGKEPLDRAAISSIRASNPFEPLPSAFSGDFIQLRFTYYYNLQPPNAH